MENFSGTIIDRLNHLSEFLSERDSVSCFTLETLLDGFQALYCDCKETHQKNDYLSNFITKCIFKLKNNVFC